MTPEEKEVVEFFTLRQFHQVPLEIIFGETIFDRIREDQLTPQEITYLIYRTDEEERELEQLKQEVSRTRPVHPKVDRLMENARAARRILLRATQEGGA